MATTDKYIYSFISDLDCSYKSFILKFEDDTKVSVSDPFECNKLQKNIDSLLKWTEDWLIVCICNIDKRKVMHFGRSNEYIKYYMKGTKLEGSVRNKVPWSHYKQT